MDPEIETKPPVLLWTDAEAEGILVRSSGSSTS
jgi:hypothetical protein